MDSFQDEISDDMPMFIHLHGSKQIIYLCFVLLFPTSH